MNERFDTKGSRDLVRELGRGSAMQLTFWIHCALFTAVNVLLFSINMLVDRSNPWFLYCVWGWGMVLVLQAGITFPWRGFFGAHALTTAVLLAGLTGINLVFGNGPWVLWVALSVGIPLFAHALYAFGRVSLLVAQAIASVLWFIEIMSVQFIYDTQWWSLLITFFTSASGFAILLIVHAAFRRPSSDGRDTIN